MLLDGRAFDAENKPDEATRKRLVESIIKDKQFINQMHVKTIQKIESDHSKDNLKRMLADMLIKEDEFLV
jgi:hypothetical protein